MFEITKNLIIGVIITLFGLIGGGVYYLGQASPIPVSEPNTIIIYRDISELGEDVNGKYIAVERNYSNIQFEELRRQIDSIFNQAHDALSEAYYEGKEFIWKGTNYGILDKETFDKMHSKFWAEYEVLFHEENLKLGLYNESEYNDILDSEGNIIGNRTDNAKQRISNYEKDGINIEL